MKAIKITVLRLYVFKELHLYQSNVRKQDLQFNSGGARLKNKEEQAKILRKSIGPFRKYREVEKVSIIKTWLSLNA